MTTSAARRRRTRPESLFLWACRLTAFAIGVLLMADALAHTH